MTVSPHDTNQIETSNYTLAELERRACNEFFAAQGLDWFWTEETHASLRRVGSIKRQLDEYGFRTGDLLTFDQLVDFEREIQRRLDSSAVDIRAEQADAAWVA